MFALPEVEGDLRAAMAHYSSWRVDGADHIRQKYDETISWIAWNSEAFPKKYGSVRRAILKRSYYIVYFVTELERSSRADHPAPVGLAAQSIGRR